MKNLSKGGLYIAIVAGCVALFLSIKLSVFYLFAFLIGLTIFLIARNKKESPANKKFLIIFVILIILSRFIVSLAVFAVRNYEIAQDEGMYCKKALIKVFEFKGMDMRGREEQFAVYFDDPDMRSPVYGYHGFTYLLTVFYGLFGYQIQGARFISAFFCIMVFLLLFYLAKGLFGSRVAKISSAIFAFLPSTTLWSTMIIADMFVLLGITACMLAMVKTVKKVKFKWILIMVFSLIAVWSVKRFVVIILLTIVVPMLSYKVFSRLTKKGKLTVLVTAILVFIAVINLPIMPLVRAKRQATMKNFLEVQRSIAKDDDSGYLIYPEHCYKELKCSPIDVARAYTKGMYYVLFSPFPWKVESKLQLMAYPQAVLWYFMMPFIAYGFYVGFKAKPAPTALIFLYSFFLFSLLALVGGNIGAVFRHKDMVMPFLIIYFALGIDKLIGRHEYTSL